MLKQVVLATFILTLAGVPTVSQNQLEPDPYVMSVRERAEYVLDITEKRFDQLLPRMMRENGLDM